LCDIILVPHQFHISCTFIFMSIWSTWRKVVGLVKWQMVGSPIGWDLAKHPIWS
jgi:hypothetical protein